MTVWNHTAADSQFAILVHKRTATQQCLLILDSITVCQKSLKLQRHFFRETVIYASCGERERERLADSYAFWLLLF